MLRNVLRVSAFGAVVIAFGLAASCATTGTPITSPITGIIVIADLLIGDLGCGTKAGQVYKYAAVVIDADGVPVAAETYDCFADGTFVNLNPSDSGSLSFTVQIFAYDQSAYLARQKDIEGDVALVNSPGSNGPVNLFPSVPSTWKTICEATQQSQVEVLAVCAPLSGEAMLDASEDATLETSTPPDANDAGAPADASTDAAPEAEAGASAEAGLPEAGTEASAADAPSG